MIEGYTDTGVTVPCYQRQKRRNCTGEFISTAIISDPGDKEMKQTMRQAERLKEKERA